MNTDSQPVQRKEIAVPNGFVEVFIGGEIDSDSPIICAAHPAGVFGEAAVNLLREIAGLTVVCVNPRGIGGSSTARWNDRSYTLKAMVADLESVRQQFGLDRWMFWGMSGGGWLSLAYACAHPGALIAIVVESVCSCFRMRLADANCILSPFHTSWQPALERRGWIQRDSHSEVGDEFATEWVEVEGVGTAFRRCDGPALLVSPMPVAAEMRAAMPMLWRTDFRDSLEKIRTRTLVIGGSIDPITPLSHVQAVHQGIAGSNLLVVEGAGHVPTTQRSPEIAARVRQFITGALTQPSY